MATCTARSIGIVSQDATALMKIVLDVGQRDGSRIGLVREAK
jgi:hypothetical protein